ncbi:MAG TPA: hypothetical protein EYO81_05500 [Gammaproteobacteria bacterium]|nr:hypothetical protein [Gammaproteobacteria bacterium]
MNLPLYTEENEYVDTDDYFMGKELELILVALQELENIIIEDNSDNQDNNNEFLLEVKNIQNKILKTIPKNLIN